MVNRVGVQSFFTSDDAEKLLAVRFGLTWVD